MTRQRLFWIALAAGVGTLVMWCTGWAAICRLSAACDAGPQSMSHILDSLLIIGVIGLLACTARTVALLARARRQMGRLHRVVPPVALLNAAARAGAAGRIACIAAGPMPAFCGGALRPRIFIDKDLPDQLQADELDAVMHHELHHARRRDPLRRASWHAAGEVFFFIPLIGWLADHRGALAEVRADQPALALCGPRAVARALWALGSSPSSPSLAGFGGAADMRVAQLLGDQQPRRRPPAGTAVASLVGLVGSLALAWCVMLGVLPG